MEWKIETGREQTRGVEEVPNRREWSLGQEFYKLTLGKYRPICWTCNYGKPQILIGQGALGAAFMDRRQSGVE